MSRFRPPVGSVTPPDAASARVGSKPSDEVHHAGESRERTPRETAERQGTCNMHAPPRQAERAIPIHAVCNAADGRFLEPEPALRSGESRRAEDAYRKTACKQRTKSERLRVAAVLLDVLERHGVSVSRMSVMVDIAEKQIHKMLAADVSVPAFLPMRLPTDMRWDFLGGLALACGCDPESSAKRVLDRIRRERDIEAAHELEDSARALSRELGREVARPKG